MTSREPIICFGQQPNGFLPKRYLYAKINTARRLQKEIGGRIAFFYHDSDADYRETITIFTDKTTGEEARLNFVTKNKIQKKYSPLYFKKIQPGWQEETARKLSRFMGQELVKIFSEIKEDTVSLFCLKMYEKLGLLKGVDIYRSGDREFRNNAADLQEYFADIPYEGEIVRADMRGGVPRLHEGGGKYIELEPPEEIKKWQKSPARAERFAWMQSVIGCTHYIAGESEAEYVHTADFPEVIFVKRDQIDKAEYAYIPKN